MLLMDKRKLQISFFRFRHCNCSSRSAWIGTNSWFIFLFTRIPPPQNQRLFVWYLRNNSNIRAFSQLSKKTSAVYFELNYLFRHETFLNRGFAIYFNSLSTQQLSWSLVCENSFRSSMHTLKHSCRLNFQFNFPRNNLHYVHSHCYFEVSNTYQGNKCMPENNRLKTE